MISIATVNADTLYQDPQDTRRYRRREHLLREPGR